MQQFLLHFATFLGVTTWLSIHINTTKQKVQQKSPCFHPNPMAINPLTNNKTMINRSTCPATGGVLKQYEGNRTTPPPGSSAIYSRPVRQQEYIEYSFLEFTQNSIQGLFRRLSRKIAGVTFLWTSKEK